ncbi:MAG TPA: ATP synthase F0 subunit B [Terriglobia bacterium]|nr:ATP synthase F0 subunit B [Terriglobia bacterium]
MNPLLESLEQLKQLFIHSIPTVIFVVVLFIILDRLLFRAIANVMKKREEETSGALERARKRASEAEAKSRAYQSAIQEARAQIYSGRQEDRQKALAERESLLKAVREQSDRLVHEARASIAAEAATAREQLAATSESLARELMERILGEGPAPAAPRGVQQ